MPQFRTTVILAGKTATGLEVPEEIIDQLASGKRPAVNVTLNNSYSYRSTIAPMSGSFWIPLAAEHRTAAGLTAGDMVEVTVDVDTAPRTVDIPSDLAAAFDVNPDAATMWSSLSYSDQRFHALQLEGAKSVDTRERRLTRIIDTLNAGRKR